jgi:hypothetical protein
VIRANNKYVTWCIGVAFLFPLFFQISAGIYDGFLLDSGGSIRNLPFPVAVIGCFGGIAVLRSHFRRAYAAMAFIAAMLAAMSLSVVFAGAGLQLELRKLILLAQFVMPMFALVLGQMVDDDQKMIPKAFLAVLLGVVPCQLLAGWLQGTLTLTHDLYVFSIYQHFQFVPLVFVCAYTYAMVALWSSHKTLLFFLLPLVFVYAIASVSFLTIAAFVIFLAVLGAYRLRVSKKVHAALVATLVLGAISLGVVGMGAYFAIAKDNSSIIGDHGQYIGKFHALAEGRLPANVSERVADWKLFGNGIMESPRTMVFGHVEPLAREVRTSAHNWYIDMAYSFGFISLLPVLVLVGYTMHLFWRFGSRLSPETRWLALIVFYLVIIDSNFKVTLRQPYSGLFTYFLWGLLLSRLRAPTLSKIAA